MITSLICASLALTALHLHDDSVSLLITPSLSLLFTRVAGPQDLSSPTIYRLQLLLRSRPRCPYDPLPTIAFPPRLGGWDERQAVFNLLSPDEIPPSSLTMSFLRKTSDSLTLSPIFPTYLIPSVPFRRKSRQSSTDSKSSIESSTSNGSSSTTSSNPFTRCVTPTPIPTSLASSVIVPPDDKFLHGHSSHIQCARCSTDLCLTSQIISKGFTGRHGRAYLVQGTTSHIQTTAPALPNTYQNKSIPRNLVTGQHVVSDISCAICGSVLGWKYVEASEESQKYKIGKFILETKRVRIGVSWEAGQGGRPGVPAYDEILPLSPPELRKLADGPVSALADEELEFDSQDEDECEDLFAGVWSPQLANKRRQRKRERFGRRPPGTSLISFGASSSVDTLS